MLGLDPDGRRVAVGGPETALHDAATLGRLATSDLSTDKVAFHPDGRQLAVAVNESFAARIVQLLDPLTLEETAVRLGGLPDPHRSLVYDLGFSADGRFLTASVGCCEHGNGTDSTLVWDLAAPERPLPVLEGVAYAPDVATFASSGNDGQVTLWDGRTGERLATTLVSGGPNLWASVEYQPDGHTLLVAGRDGAATVGDTTFWRG